MDKSQAWYEGWAVIKDFPGHKGRPGQVGGSLPREGGGGVPLAVSGSVNTGRRTQLTKKLGDEIRSAGGFDVGGAGFTRDNEGGEITFTSGSYTYDEETDEERPYEPDKDVPALLEGMGYKKVSTKPEGVKSSPWAIKGSRFFQSEDGNTVLEYVDEQPGNFPAVLQVSVYD